MTDRQLNVVVPEELHAWLKAEAWRRRQTMSEMVRELLTAEHNADAKPEFPTREKDNR